MTKSRKRAAPASSRESAVGQGRRIPCEKCPLRALPVLRKFTPEEVEFVSNLKSGELNVEAGTNILLQGTNSAHLYTVLAGWAFRYKMLADGRRQILNFALPSDFLGLQGAVANEMQHSIEALTDMTLCIFPRERLWELYTHYPSLSYDVTWIAARSEQYLDESLVNIGRRGAMERMAYLLLHMYVRAEKLGLAKGSAVQFPFTQQHVADTLGMSLVHANKTLKRLTASKTMRWKDRTFELLDRDGLLAIAGYEMPPEHVRPLI